MSNPNWVVCAVDALADEQALIDLGVSAESRFVLDGVLDADDVQAWIGVEPLPAGSRFSLRTWDEPVYREPGWQSFEGVSWMTNAQSLIAFAVQS